MNQPQDNDVTAAAGGDIYSKSLALMRRLFVGNGFKLEEVQIKQLESKDIKLTGCLSLDLEIQQKAIRYAGTARGGEAKVFQTRDEQAHYLGNINSEMGADENWLNDIRTILDKQPHGGWGMAGGKWPIQRLNQRVALVLPCDVCRGQRYESCIICYGQREIPCTQCNGTGATANGQNCHNCRGARHAPCSHCGASGRSLCRECQGQGYFTEETTLTAVAHGHFQASATGSMPQEVMNVLDHIGSEGIADGHAAIAPNAAADAQMANALNYTATIPWGKFNLELGHDNIEFYAVGQLPVLNDFPYALDDILAPISKQLNTVHFNGLTRQFRILRELRDALAKGVKPATFFTRKYPYGLSAKLAFELASKVRRIFSTISFQPRLVTAGITGLITAGLYAVWLYNPRPDFLPLTIPIATWDTLLLVILMGINWFSVAKAGQKALRAIMPVKLAPAGGRIAYAAAAISLTLSSLMLISPFLRPEWVAAIIR